MTLIVIGILIYVIYTLFVQQKTLNAYKNEEKYYIEEHQLPANITQVPQHELFYGGDDDAMSGKFWIFGIKNYALWSAA